MEDIPETGRVRKPRKTRLRAPVRIKLPTTGMILEMDAFSRVSWHFAGKGDGPRYRLAEVIGMATSYQMDIEHQHRIWRSAVKAWLKAAYEANADHRLNPLRARPTRPAEEEEEEDEGDVTL